MKNKKVGCADSIPSGRLSCYSGNIAGDISYIIKKDGRSKAGHPMHIELKDVLPADFIIRAEECELLYHSVQFSG